MEVELVDFHDVVGFLQRPIDVAVVVHPLPGDVVAERLVEDVGIGIGGGNGIDVHRKRLVLHLDLIRGVDGELSGLGEHHNDGLALIANDVDPEEVLLQRLPVGLRGELEQRFRHRLDLITGEGGDDTRHCLGLGHVDADDLGVGMGGADIVGEAHAVHALVVHKRSLSLEESLVLLARHALAHPLDGRGGFLGRGGHTDTSFALVACTARTMLT